jgi:hypothetical protein
MASLFQTLETQWTQLRQRMPQRDVCLAPPDAFFAQRFDIPEGMTEKEIPDFAAISLESNAPFPVEQMLWGYLYHPQSPWILVYATPKSRLKKLGLEDLDSWHHIFPGYLSIYGKTYGQPNVCFICQTGAVSALFYSADNPIPEKIVSRSIGEPLLTDEAILKSRAQLQSQLQKPNNPYHWQDFVYVGETSLVHNDGRCGFFHRVLSDKEPCEAPEDATRENIPPLSIQKIWQADVRDEEFAVREAKKRQLGQRIWHSLVIGCGVTVLLLVMQIGLFAMDFWNHSQDQKILSLEPDARRVEHKLTLANRLTQSVEEDIHPFRMLSTVNENRPSNVFFNKVGARNFRQLEIEGESSAGITPVNNYADRLLAAPEVIKVVNNPSTRVGRTSFDFVVTFDIDNLARRQDEALPEPPVEEGEEVEPGDETEAPEVARRESQP